MSQAPLLLLGIALLSLLFRDFVLAAASAVLMALAMLDLKQVLVFLQKQSFTVGIFFLMLFLLLPIANEKVKVLQIAKELLSFKGLIAIAAGFVISYIGGKGVGILPDQPVVLLGVILGTLAAVLLFDGLPAGLIIAAGLIGVLKIIP